MHLFKRTLSNGKKSKVWWFEFVHRGVRYRESTKLKSRREAQDLASAFRLRLIEGELNVNRKRTAPTFAAAMAEFLEWSRGYHQAHPNTTLRYETSSRPLLKFFGQALIDTITPEDIERYRRRRKDYTSERTGRKLKPATINRELAALKALFNFFVKQDLITRNPVSRVQLQAENNEQMRVLSFEEENLYLAACSQPLRDVAIMMLETGMRPEEVYRIHRKNVHIEKGYIFNPHGKTKAARRKITLTGRAIDMLKGRIEAGSYLFPHKDDPEQPMIKANHAHYGALKRSGLDHFRLYDLRHTFATRFIEAGGDLVTLAAILGHSKIQMVMRYAHPTEGHQATAIKKMEDFAASRRFDVEASELVN